MNVLSISNTLQSQTENDNKHAKSKITSYKDFLLTNDAVIILDQIGRGIYWYNCLYLDIRPELRPNALGNTTDKTACIWIIDPS